MVYYLDYRLVLKMNFTLVPASFANLETLRITVAATTSKPSQTRIKIQNSRELVFFTHSVLKTTIFPNNEYSSRVFITVVSALLAGPGE